LRLGGLSTTSGVPNRYRYNGKELHDELGLGWYDYGFRWYDPAVARFVSVDPLAESFPELTTYQYASNTPIQAIDLDGLEMALATTFVKHVGKTDAANVSAGKKSTTANLIAGGVKGTLRELADYTDAGDVSAVVTTFTRGGPQNAVNLSGEKVGIGGLAMIGLGVAVPFVSGSLLKKLGEGLGALFGVGKKGDIQKVYTTTDGPVDLNRQPSGVEGSSESFGGTYVTKSDITNPDNLVDHMNVVPPKIGRESSYPNRVTEIEVPSTSLKPDPSVSNPTPGTSWLPPKTPGAKVTREFSVTEDPTTLKPIITPLKPQN